MFGLDISKGLTQAFVWLSSAASAPPGIDAMLHRQHDHLGSDIDPAVEVDETSDIHQPMAASCIWRDLLYDGHG
jgi:hypothetical protein